MSIQRGDTVRLKATFKDWDGQAADPDSVTVKIYNDAYKALETQQLGPANKVAIGEYYYDYTVPVDAASILYYEFSGQLNGTTALRRDRIDVAFI